MNEHYDELETRSPQQRDEAQLKALNSQLAHARQSAPAYSEILADHPPLTSLADLASYPVTRKSQLHERQTASPPFGGLSAFEPGQLAYIFASPGPIYEPATRRGDYWRFARTMYAAGFRPDNLAINCFSYHLTPAGFMADSGCHALGCAVIPAGTGQSELQVQTIADLKPSAYVGTPSFLKILLEKATETGADISCLQKALVSGEALPPSLRGFFQDHGISMLQCYATADLGVIGYESAPDSGLIVDEGLYLEIVTPGTGDTVAKGEVGEVVVTTLNPDYPLIRFATGDLSAFMDGTSECGRTNRRIKGWMGRADQTAKVRGMFVRPSLVAQVVKRHPQIHRARLMIDWVDASDAMTLLCECDEPGEDLRAAVVESIREVCKLRGEVEFVSAGSIARDGVVIEDIRKYE